MFVNYLKIAFRNLLKSKYFFLINLSGLVTGMLSFFLILQFVVFELSYDRFHENADRIYRVVNDRFQNGKLIQHGTITYSGVGQALKDDFDEVELNLRVFSPGEVIINYEGEVTAEEATLAVDASFFELFSFPLIAGEPHLLSKANEIALSEPLARRIFHYKGNDLGQFINATVMLDRMETPFMVKGIFEDIPPNSHLRPHLLMPYQMLIDTWNWQDADNNFISSNFWHYVLIKPDAELHKIHASMEAFSERHFRGTEVTGTGEKFYLQPLLDAHLHSDFEYEIGIVGNGDVVYGLGITAFLIMMLAWINYINLSNARSMERAKEVGIRKSIGARKSQLIWQFLCESLLLNAIAVIITITSIQLVQPGFNNMLQAELSLSQLLSQELGGASVLLYLVAFVVAGVILSGYYPAFVLSSFKTVKVLKGKITSTGKGRTLRRALVVFQFATTVIMVLAAIVVYQQLRFISKKDLGFDLNQTLVIRAPLLTEWDSTFVDRSSAFTSELLQHTGIRAAASSGSRPGNRLGRSFDVRRVGENSDLSVTLDHNRVDHNFLDLYNIPVVAGRNFKTSDYHADFDVVHNIILNQSATALLNFASPAEAVGQSITINGKHWDVVGVVKDFHQQSLRHPVGAMCLQPLYSTWNSFSVKIDARDIPNTLGYIEQRFDSFFPGNVFDYYFLDVAFDNLYRGERLFASVLSLFTVLAIVVGCLGLLGLTTYTITQRTKEIGIRKVLGASVRTIVGLLTKEVFWLMLLANLMALPVAYLFIVDWLQSYAFKVNVTWWMLCLPLLAMVMVTALTIGYQTVKISLKSPVDSLRSE